MISGERRQLARQLEHWGSASERISRWETFAPDLAWEGLEQYLGIALRRSLNDAVMRLRTELETARRMAEVSDTVELDAAIQSFRRRYERVESVIDFFVDALNTRGAPYMGAMLSTCDRIVDLSMAAILVPLGYSRPPVLVYVDRGLGASILKAGLRLWDGSTENPAAAIKVTFHNLLRPTALIHEAGHQVAEILNWNRELATCIEQEFGGTLGSIWSSWASEMAADVFAFVHTGYAAVAAGHDVLDGGNHAVFRYIPGDPHPISFLRVLLGVEMCRLAYGRGAWDELADTWRVRYPFDSGSGSLRPLLEGSLPLLPRIAHLLIHKPFRCFRGRPLSAWVDPQRVSPSSLWELERRAGAALYVSPYWAHDETLRIVALSGYRIANEPQNAAALLTEQEKWMIHACGNQQT